MSDDMIFDVPETAKQNTLADEQTYFAMYEESLQDPDSFWDKHGRRIDWINPIAK